MATVPLNSLVRAATRSANGSAEVTEGTSRVARTNVTRVGRMAPYLTSVRQCLSVRGGCDAVPTAERPVERGGLGVSQQIGNLPNRQRIAGKILFGRFPAQRVEHFVVRH